VNGGHCLLPWARVCQPPRCGGLGVLGPVWMWPQLALPMHGRAKILAHVLAAHALPIRWRENELSSSR
jgi:hypothetical protein